MGTGCDFFGTHCSWLLFRNILPWDDRQLNMATGEAFESSQYTEMKSAGKDGWPKCLLLINIECTKTSQHAPWRCALIMSVFSGYSFFTLHLFIVCE